MTIFQNNVGKKHEFNRMGYIDMRNLMDEADLRLLGQGCYGSVWQKPGTDTVLKLASKNSDEDGYFNYVLFCLTRPRPTVHTPMFDAIEVYDKFILVEMEQLLPMPGELYRSSGLSHLPNPKDITIPSLSAFIAECEEYRKPEKMICGKFGADYHAGNLMIRPSTNDIVVTDPWA